MDVHYTVRKGFEHLARQKAEVTREQYPLDIAKLLKQPVSVIFCRWHYRSGNVVATGQLQSWTLGGCGDHPRYREGCPQLFPIFDQGLKVGSPALRADQDRNLNLFHSVFVTYVAATVEVAVENFPYAFTFSKNKA